jgi:putative endonuclease
MLPDVSGHSHWVYLLECRTGEIYVGQTADLERRLSEHNTSRKGARFTSGRRPVELRAAWGVTSRSAALRVEAFIRRGGRRRKDDILARPARLRSLLHASGMKLRVTLFRAPRRAPIRAGGAPGIERLTESTLVSSRARARTRREG